MYIYMKKLLLILTLLIGPSMLFFGVTDPDSIPVALLMVPIILAFLITTFGTLLIMKVLSISSGRPQRQKALAALAGTLAAFFLVFQSTGGAVVGDVMLLGLVLIVAYIYISRY